VTIAEPIFRGEHTLAFDYEVLDADLTVYDTVRPTVEGGPNITANTDQAVKRNLSGFDLIAAEVARVANPLGDRIRPIQVLSDGSRWPLGVYLFGERQTEHFSGSTFFSHVSLMDQAWILDQPLDRSVSVKPGDDCLGLFVTLAQEVGVTNVRVDPTNQPAGAPGAWAAGNSRYGAMADLATLMGCVAPYFDNVGYLRLSKAPDSTSSADFLYAPGSVYADSILDTDDSYQAPNRYIVIGTGTVPVVGTYDVPDAAPQSAAQRGFVVTQTVDAPGVETAFAASEAARAKGITDSRSYVRTSFTTPVNPRHDLFNVIDFDGALWLEVEQRIGLTFDGDHEHTLARLW